MLGKHYRKKRPWEKKWYVHDRASGKKEVTVPFGVVNKVNRYQLANWKERKLAARLPYGHPVRQRQRKRAAKARRLMKQHPEWYAVDLRCRSRVPDLY